MSVSVAGIPKNRCRTTVAERMVETLAELPFIDDQVGLFRARPVGQVRAVRVSLVQSQLVALALLRARVVLSVSAHPRPMSGELCAGHVQ